MDMSNSAGVSHVLRGQLGVWQIASWLGDYYSPLDRKIIFRKITHQGVCWDLYSRQRSREGRRAGRGLG